jgi:hypothetical protein
MHVPVCMVERNKSTQGTHMYEGVSKCNINVYFYHLYFINVIGQ